MRSPPSLLNLYLITSHRPHLQMPSRWGLVLSIWILGKQKHSIHSTSPKHIHGSEDNIVNVAALHKLIYRVSAVPTRISADFLEIFKLILKFLCNCKGENSQNYLEKRRTKLEDLVWIKKEPWTEGLCTWICPLSLKKRNLFRTLW